MKAELTNIWMTRMREGMAKSRHGGPAFTLTTQFPNAVTWLVLELTKENIPFRLVNVGGGVKTITTDTATCPKCGGTGRC